MPKIQISSDGTKKNTELSIDGKTIKNCCSIYFAHYGGDPSFSYETEEPGKNGMVKRTNYRMVSKNAEVNASLIETPSSQEMAISSTHPKVKDKQDHFPIHSETYAQNVLTMMDRFTCAPSWWSGSLADLKSHVKGAIKAKFPNILAKKLKKETKKMEKVSDKPGVLNHKKDKKKNKNIYAHPGEEAPELTKDESKKK